MALAISCPGCETTLNVSETLAGKSIKCRTCGEMIAVTAPVKVAKAAPVKKAAAVVDDDDDRPVKKKVSLRDDRFEDDDDDRPRKAPAKAGGSKLPMILGLAIGAVVLLGAGIGGAYAIFGGKKDEPVVQNTTPAPTPAPAPAQTPSQETKKTEPEKKDTETTVAKADNKADETKSPETKTPEKKPETAATPDEPKKTTAAEPAAPKSDDPGISSTEKRRRYVEGNMDDFTLRKAKKGTVFIICESNFSKSTGSGWFGVEENIVVTNAHVIDMIAPNSPPPKKLTIVLNSGEYGQNPGIQEREIPHQRIKILAVDRHYDIAILQITGEKDLPPPFKVLPSGDLRENQGIQIGGFPLGFKISGATGSRKKPSISMRKSSVSGLKYDDYGILYRVQVQGGISPGNSGGPQFDADGNVIAMTVEIMNEDKTIGLAVPTEHILGLMAGRVDEVEVDTAYLKDGMVNIPVRVTSQDPMKRLKSIGIATWIGESNGQYRPPGTVRRGMLNSDKDYKEVTLSYDPSKKEATGVLTMPQLTPGMSYWIQPFYQNSITPKYYTSGTKIDTKGPPCELKPSNLVVNLRPGPIRPFTLLRKGSEDDYMEGEGEEKQNRLKQVLTMKGTEQVLAKAPTDTQSAARLRLRYTDCDLKFDIANQELAFIPPRIMKQLQDGIKQMEAWAYVTQSGQIYKTQSNALGVTDPVIRVVGPQLSDEILESLRVCCIPLPNRDVQPNESWTYTGQQKYMLNFVDQNPRSGGGQPPRPGEQPGGGQGSRSNVVARKEFAYQIEEKFTYQGVRVRGGRNEAVVRISGKVTPAAGKPKDSANGLVKGYAFIDVASGIVIDAEIDTEFELDTSIEGIKQRSYTVNNYKLSRDGNVK